MSEIMLNVRDGTRDLHTTIHASYVDPVVAALSADPETIEELEASLRRFLPRDEWKFFAHWRQGVCEEPWDAGLGIIDLAARLVAVQSSYDAVLSKGGLEVRDPRKDERAVVPFHVADDWLFTSNVECWRGLAEERRRVRLASPAFDARPVLYSK